MPKIIRIILYICITAILLGSISYLLLGKKSVIVETVIPERKTIIETVKTVGVTIPTTETALSFDISGVIENIYTKEGETVKSGTVLALISVKEYENKVRVARTNLFRERETLNTLVDDIEQGEKGAPSQNKVLENKDAIQSGAIFPSKKYTVAESVAQQNKVKQEKALIISLQESFNEALLSQLKTRIIAPFDATITAVAIDKGGGVEQNNTAISVISANPFQVETSIKGEDIFKVKVGNTVDVTFDTYGKGVIFPALVTRIDTYKEKMGGPTYTAIITFDTADTRITGNMKAKLSIHTYTREDTLTLPVRFIRTLSSKKGEVSIVEKQGTHTKEIDMGVVGDSGDVEILGGLEVDDLVQSVHVSTKKINK